MRKFLGVVVASALCLAPATARAAAGVATTGAEFLKLGVGARALAMGSAYSALADEPTAMYWNPGALGALKDRGVTMSYNMLFQDESQGYLAYVHPVAGVGVFGGGLDYLSVRNIEKRAGDTESPDATFNNNNFALNASYGTVVAAIDGLSVGGSLKYIRETLDTFSASAVAIDFGAQSKTRCDNLTVGASFQNLGTKIGPDPLPTLFKGGAAYKAMDKKLALSSDLDWWLNDQRMYLDLGSELWVNKALAFRAGYQWGRNNDHLSSSFVGMSFGLGVWIDRFRMDYAFLPFGNLGDTHRITLGWTF